MDAIYQEWFDANTVKVAVKLANAHHFLSKREIIELTGAPKSSNIVVRQEGKSIALIVSNPIFAEDMYRYLIQDNDEKSYHLRNVVLVFKDQYTNKGIGTRCVVKEIHAAAQLASIVPIRFIKVDAVGNLNSFADEKYPMRGYYVWARMGFDGKIPAPVMPKLRAKYRKCVYVSELMREKEGQMEWLMHGDSIQLAFDLTPGSASWALLLQYMKEKDIHL
jgi:hypothetical protein